MEIKLLKHIALTTAKKLRLNQPESEIKPMTQEKLISWRALATNILDLLGSDNEDAYPCVPNKTKIGQVWSLKHESKQYITYLPPQILLIEKIDGSHGFNVAQLYFDNELIGPFDVPLNEIGMFAEAWHTYSVHEKYLDKCWGDASNNAVDSVLMVADYLERVGSGEQSEKLNSIKQKIVNCGIQVENDIDPITTEFRDLELQVGEYYCQPSFTLLTEELEAIENNESPQIICDQNKLSPSSNVVFIQDYRQKYIELSSRGKVVNASTEDFLKSNGVHITGMKLAAGSSGLHKTVFTAHSNKVEVVISWTEEIVTIEKAKYRGNGYHKFQLIFINPDTDIPYNYISFDSNNPIINEKFTSNFLKFSPYEQKWTVRLGIADE